MVEGTYDTSVTPIFIAAGQGLKKGYQSPRIIRQVDMAPTVHTDRSDQRYLSGIYP